MTVSVGSISDPLVCAVSATGRESRALVRDAVTEILDANYKHLIHGKRHTRNKGCTGPLCRKALRDWRREHTSQRNAQAGRDTEPRTRNPGLILADAELDRLYIAYKSWLYSWINDEIDPRHTVLLVSHIMQDWVHMPAQASVANAESQQAA